MQVARLERLRIARCWRVLPVQQVSSVFVFGLTVCRDCEQGAIDGIRLVSGTPTSMRPCTRMITRSCRTRCVDQRHRSVSGVWRRVHFQRYGRGGPPALLLFECRQSRFWSDGATEPIGLVVPVDVLADAPSVVLNTSRACDVQPEMGSSYPQDADATQKSEGLVRVRGGAALKMRVKAQ